MKNINFKNRPRKTKKEIINKRNKALYLLKNTLKILFVTLFIIAFFLIIAKSTDSLVHGYSRVLKDYSSFINQYEIKDRIELVDAKHIMFDKETYPNADEYYNVLTHYNEEKDSTEMQEIKDKLANSYLVFTLDSNSNTNSIMQTYSDGVVYVKIIRDNKLYLKNFEYSKAVNEPKIKLIYKDKYNVQTKKIIKKAKTPQKDATLILPKEDDNE